MIKSDGTDLCDADRFHRFYDAIRKYSLVIKV